MRCYFTSSETGVVGTLRARSRVLCGVRQRSAAGTHKQQESTRKWWSMKKFSSFTRIAPILVAAVLFTAQNAMAANLTFSFGASDTPLGHTATSTNGGYTLNAAAFTTGSSNLFLYNKVT